MCEALGVRLASYYQWIRAEARRAERRERERALADVVIRVFEENRRTYVIIPERRSRQSGKMGATIPDLESHLFIVLLFGQIQRVVVARDFISLFARAACLQAA